MRVRAAAAAKRGARCRGAWNDGVRRTDWLVADDGFLPPGHERGAAGKPEDVAPAVRSIRSRRVPGRVAACRSVAVTTLDRAERHGHLCRHEVGSTFTNAGS